MDYQVGLFSSEGAPYVFHGIILMNELVGVQFDNGIHMTLRSVLLFFVSV